MAEKKTLEVLTKDKIWRMGKYQPYRLKDGTLNPDCNKFSKAIMDLKTPSEDAEDWMLKKHKTAIRYFTKALQETLDFQFSDQQNLQIAIVPSSDAGKISMGLESIVTSLDTEIDTTFEKDFLARTRSVTKAHKGGNRSFEKHISTIDVVSKPDPNVPILILDDVTTTGNSLRACRELLQGSGCKHIIMLAIGKTVDTDE